MASVVTNYNIKQVTNYDIQDAAIIQKIVSIPSRVSDGNGGYTIVNTDVTVDYKTAVDGVNILKMGYCCEPKGIDYPIYLQMNGSYKEFKVGRDGMYEMQPENWQNVNLSDPTEKTTDIIITGVRVPANIEFTLDYVVSIN